jgi:hypothetical protein
MKPVYYVCIIIVLFFSACEVPMYVTVPVEYTPHSYFGKDTTTIVIVNGFNADALGIANKRKLAAIKAGAYTAIKSAGMQLGQLQHVKTINLVDSVGFKVNTDSVKLLAQKYKANYVLLLKKFSAGIDMGMDGSSTFYSTNVSVNFLLYDSGGVYYKKLDGTANDPKSDQPYMGLLAAIALQPTVGRNKAAINTSAEHAVQNALQEYFPYTIAHDRPLYNDDFLKPAVAEILAGNFDKAGNLLEQFVQDKNPEIVSKASYNMAVVYEAEGDIGAAIALAKQSSDKHHNEFATAILYDLKQE